MKNVCLALIPIFLSLPGSAMAADLSAPSDLSAVPDTAQAGARQAGKPTCAVLNFDAQVGITKEETVILSERFAIEFGKLGKYQLISRSKMKEVLDLQKFARSDNCSATECAIEAGKYLARNIWSMGQSASWAGHGR